MNNNVSKLTGRYLKLAVLLPFSSFLMAAGTGSGELVYAESADKHFHPEGKPPSEYTLAVIREARESMPFSDKRDFEEASKGFIAAPDSKIIKADAGHVAWDMERYQFLAQGRQFDSIHPSLQRQSTLNLNFGLYEVMPGIWQVRGFDLANITFIRGKTGWIVFDPTTGRDGVMIVSRRS